MIIKAIAPWFGGKRTMAPDVVKQLGRHTQYFEPFCGSMAVLFAKEPSQKETVNDLHGDLINLARILQRQSLAEELYDRLCRTLFCEDLLIKSQTFLGEHPFIDREDPDEWDTLPVDLERAYWYFLASWMGRNGTAGTKRVEYQVAVRWTKGGGSPTVRWKHAVESIPWWHERLRNVVILHRDAFRILDRFEDVPQTAIYIDTPYMHETRTSRSTRNGNSSAYLHDFESSPEQAGGLFEKEEQDPHQRVAEVLRVYKQARIVVSYYDHPRVRELYEGWTFIDKTRHKHLHTVGGRGKRPKDAPELLIVNGEEYR